MAGLSRRVHHGLIIATVALLGVTMVAPAATLADTNLEIGGVAIIAYANGDNVRLRDGADYGASVLDMVPEGSLVDVYDGPISADDGSLWYNVGYDGQSGYIVADYLALPSADGGTVPANATVLDAEGSASADGIAAGSPVGIAYIAGTNGDGVRCRADASTGAAVVTVLPEGTTVELTGDVIDVWQPINCAGRGGYVHVDFVSYDGSGIETDEADEAPAAGDEPVADDGGDFGGDTVTGSAVVVATNGGGLRCRAEASTGSDIVVVIKEGRSVDLRGDASGAWQPVFCDGTAGYVSTEFLSYDGSDAASDDDVTAAEEEADGVGAELFATSSTGLATIGDTNGDGLRCRSKANTNSSVIVVLREGSTVELRGNASGVWQPVRCAGSNGFVHSDYILYDGGSGDDGTGSADENGDTGGDTGGDDVTGNATVVDTNGGGLRCRSSASYDGSILTVIGEGASVRLRGDASGGWQPVFCAGSRGFVHTDFLSYGGSSGGDDSSGDDGGDTGGSSGGGSTSGFSAGDAAEVSGTNGDGVRFRSGPGTSNSVISVLREGTVVEVISGSSGAWVAISYNGSEGYVHSDFLAPSDGSSSNGGGGSTDEDDDVDTGSNSGGGSGLSDGDHAKTSASLNLRYDPSFSAGVAAVAPAGTVVLITGIAEGGFYAVDWDGLQGYMHGDYLTASNAELSERGGSGAPSGDGDGVSGGGSGDGGGGGGSGSAIANYAMQYLGYPYVWASHGPSSFDCSGFTYWVTLNTLGINIGTGTASQVSAGRTVSRDSLQPGDLVFFQNTYTWGLSHVGIYIGNGQFIHAENESTGVVISSLSSSYYSSRWYGAVRLV